MRAYASLWSADLLALGDAVRLVEREVDGFHVDVFDGHDVPDLLFGPDLVAALAARTAALVDVHLNVEDPDAWARRFTAAGAGMVTVQLRACPDVRATLRAIAAAGARPAVALELTDDASTVRELLEEVDRVLVMGTRIGVKGLDLDAGTGAKLRALRRMVDASARRPELVVDGGIRRHVVAELAAAGADGIVPGSLVFGDPDPIAAARWIRGIPTARAVAPS